MMKMIQSNCGMHARCDSSGGAIKPECVPHIHITDAIGNDRANPVTHVNHIS